MLTSIHLKLIVLAFFSFVMRGNAQVSDNGVKTYAVIVGISEYSNLNESNKLKFAHIDANKIASWIEKEDEVIIFKYLNDKATNKDSITNKIISCLKRARGGDRVIIYFAGHGEYSIEDGEGYLLLHNVQPPTLSDFVSSDALRIKPIVDRVLTADQKGVEVLLIIDACKSGYAERVMVQKEIEEPANSIFLLSSKRDQKSQESKDLGHGVFTYYLMQGIKGGADTDLDGYVSGREIKKYLEENVREATKKQQDPVVKTPFEFIIGQVFTELSSNEGVNVNFNNLTSRGVSLYEAKHPRFCDFYKELLEKRIYQGKFFEDELGQSEKPSISSSKAKWIDEGFLSIEICTEQNSIFALNQDGKIYRIFEKKVIPFFEIDNELITNIKLASTKSNLIVSTQIGNIYSVDVSEMSYTKLFNLKNERVESLFITSSDELVVTTNKKHVLFYDFSSSKISNKIKLKNVVKNIVQAENDLILYGDNSTISIFDLTLQVVKKTINSTGDKATSVLYSKKWNRLYILGNDNFLTEWDRVNYKTINSMAYKDVIGSLVIDPFEEFILLSNEKNKTIEIYSIRDPKDKIKSLSINAKPDFLNSGFNEEILYFLDHQGRIGYLIFQINPSNNSATQIISDIHCYQNEFELFDMHCSLALGMRKFVTPVLERLLTEGSKPVIEEEMKRALRYSKEIKTKYYDCISDEISNEIDFLLLEVFEVLLFSDTQMSLISALEKANRIIELDSNGAYGHVVLGKIHGKLDQYQKSIISFQQAEKLSPSWVVPKLDILEFYLKNGDYSSAEEKAREVIGLTPKYSRGYQMMGKVLLLTNRPEDAKRYFAIALSLNPNLSLESSELKLLQEGLSTDKTDNSENIEDPSILIKQVRLGMEMMGGIVVYVDETGQHGLIVKTLSTENFTYSQALELTRAYNNSEETLWIIPSIKDLNLMELSKSAVNLSIPFWLKDVKDAKNAFWSFNGRNLVDYTLKSNLRSVVVVRNF
jgi:tetratricopeptide (TPR) repeat protein